MSASSDWQGEGERNSHKMSHPLHAPTLLSALNEHRKIPSLCDGILQFDNTVIHVQRNVLAAASPYFRALYQYETQPCKNTVKMDTISHSVFEQILDYIYTSVILLDEDNIQDILQAADLLLMCDLKDLCCDYLEQCITTANCLGVRDFAERFSCPRVLYAATNYLDENFLKVTYCEEFMQLDLTKIKQILQRNTLAVQTENAIFDAVIRWVQHDTDARKQHLEELLTSCIHMGLLDERYLQEYVIPDHLIRSCELEGLVLRLRRQDQSSRQRGCSNMILVAGGEGPSDSEADIVEIKNNVSCVAFHKHIDSQSLTWIELSPMQSARVGHGLVQAGGCLYAVGGRDNTGRILNSCERYDPTMDTWTYIDPMHHARVGFGLVTIDDRIYAVGGSNDMSDPLTSVEEYNIYTNKWRRLPDMNLKRAWSAYGVANKKIFVVGGGIMGKLYEAVECFDPRSETWTSVAPMKERRFDARAVGIGNMLYVFGGLRRLECPSAMQSGTGMKFCGTELYSTDTKNWTAMGRDYGMCNMTESCHIDAVTKHGDEILVIGALDIGGTYNCVRAYNTSTNQWRGVVQNHPPNLRGMQSCMLKISNSLIYSHIQRQQQGAYKNKAHTD